MPRGRTRFLLAVVGAILLAACAAPAASPPQPSAPAIAQAPPSPGQPAGQPPMTMPPNPMIGGVAMYPSRDIAENLALSPDHHTLIAALNVAGLVGALKQ